MDPGTIFTFLGLFIQPEHSRELLPSVRWGARVKYPNVKCAEVQNPSALMSTRASLSVLAVRSWNVSLLSGCKLGSVHVFGHTSLSRLADMSRIMTQCGETTLMAAHCVVYRKGLTTGTVKR